MTMSSFFAQFDLFGVKPLLYFKGKLKFGTIFGFFLTLFLASFSILCLFFFGQNLYNKKNPISSSNEEYIHLPESFTIDPESFPFAIEINSPTGNVFYTDSTMVQAYVTSFSLEKTSYPPKIEVSTYKMEICNKTHFQKCKKKL